MGPQEECLLPGGIQESLALCLGLNFDLFYRQLFNFEECLIFGCFFFVLMSYVKNNTLKVTLNVVQIGENALEPPKKGR
jgi:hypothetical protein